MYKEQYTIMTYFFQKRTLKALPEKTKYLTWLFMMRIQSAIKNNIPNKKHLQPIKTTTIKKDIQDE
jgi:uncharacterized protein YqcC (DUF446 family)